MATVVSCGETATTSRVPADSARGGVAPIETSDQVGVGGGGHSTSPMPAGAPGTGVAGAASSVPGGGTGPQGAAGHPPGSAGTADAGAAADGPEPDPARDPEWAMWVMPSWPDSGLPHPPHYTARDDGTVVDDVTGLVWSKQRNGGAPWDAAIAACGPGFRVPSIIELVSIANPVTARVDETLSFSSKGRSVGSWSSSPVAEHPQSAWHFYGGEGSTYSWQKSTSYDSFCVKGGKVSLLPHYEVTSEGAIAAVRDNWTGLVWQREHSEQTLAFADAQQYCATMGSGFRSPSIKELNTLVDRRRFSPAIDTSYFPNTPSARFWSGTAATGSRGYLVEFQFGSGNTYDAELDGYSRCVRSP
jgi:hypothetical protein